MRDPLIRKAKKLGQKLVIPYDKFGDCIFLGTNMRCSIYEERPTLCRLFDCRVGFKPDQPLDRQGLFIQARPAVVELLRSLPREQTSFT